MTELSTRYNPNEVEDKWCRIWEEQNLFHAEPNPKKKPFSIVIPPPNVTGILHMGHALNNTLQDILVRYKRMQGFEALWMPGTDHAGIATQNVVEKQLAKEGKKRQDIGREEFIKRLWEWKRQYGDTIIHQLKKLGSSCDWPRTRFTMDEHYSTAVTYVFVELYKKGLIYRGQYIINWCPRCQTALSDEEAEHKETQGSLYYFRYPLKENPKKFVVVATTRPETMLGDTAVAVNPKDKRYKKLIGKSILLPLMNREIKIIADALVHPKFGTGAVKVTPAHDPNDFVMGKRHDLEFINIMHPDARLNENAGAFSGQDRFAGRKAVVEALQNLNLLEKIEPHPHAVRHCYRCHTTVEPTLSKQWFVKMKPLAKPALKVVKEGKIKFYPDRWTKVYLNWMEGIQDWCISRQIWWGHRIPVWYCSACPEGKNIVVAQTSPKECPHCHGKNLTQDPDVLDTWFSSWLWPFATLNWPQKSKDLDYFYPTSALFTAPEIIFFWVARMIMAGLEFMKDIPFSDVYIHGTVRDAKGQKMSKSLGNALDPLEIIKEYGADALRFSLIINSGQDLFIAKEKFEIGRNFANKLWNATRLIQMNVGQNSSIIPQDVSSLKIKDLDIESQWIVSRFQGTLKQVTKAIENYRYSEAETLIYDFFWKNFCDWYLEIIKDKFTDPSVQNVALALLEGTLKILHPFMPFVTEEIFSQIHPGEKPLSVQAWPQIEKKLIDLKVEEQMEGLIDLISEVRNVRVHWNITPNQAIDLVTASSDKSEIGSLRKNAAIIKKLAKVNELTIEDKLPKKKDSAGGIVGKTKFLVPLSGIIDLVKEKERMVNEINQQRNNFASISQRLKNKDFLKKAPAEVVQKDKARLETLTTRINELKKIIKDLED